jgi:hypothetical protein
MTAEDQRELEWWRHFRSKFMGGDIPAVGSSLLGHRFAVYYDHKGVDVPWRDRVGTRTMCRADG